MVSLASSRWGESWEAAPMDHVEEIGWSIGSNASAVYERIVLGLAAKGL